VVPWDLVNIRLINLFDFYSYISDKRNYNPYESGAKITFFEKINTVLEKTFMLSMYKTEYQPHNK